LVKKNLSEKNLSAQYVGEILSEKFVGGKIEKKKKKKKELVENV
jgi:hypothetical protein